MSSLLVVTSRAEDVSELNEILRETSWLLTDVSSLDDAIVKLKAVALPIIFYDRDAAGVCWQETIERLIAARQGACVVLISNVADQYLWEEVVQHGGFDLLSRPFRKDQVLSALAFAHAHLRAPWPRVC